ncbi:MAG: bifunctional phosphoglucose/phosphomannose isomerase [Armatimonadota bacterium]
MLSTLTHDKTDFLKLVLDFPEQVERALGIARLAPLPEWKATPDNLLLIGMGGSAAGGGFLQALFNAQGKVPFEVSRTYTLPSWVGPGTLVLACSYSGNTEETLASYDEAKRRGANIIAVSSGGELALRCRADGFPLVLVPGGQPPRTALGYMLVPGVVACQRLGLLPDLDWQELIDQLKEVRATNQPSTESSLAKALAATLEGKVPVVYGQSHWTEAVAVRWRGQINENSKAMCLTHVFPELCHNEILGWEGSASQGRWHVVLFTGGDESDQMKKRVAETLNLTGVEYTELVACGGSLLSRMLGLAYTGDFVSLYLAELTGQDPAQMKAIDELKARLA